MISSASTCQMSRVIQGDSVKCFILISLKRKTEGRAKTAETPILLIIMNKKGAEVRIEELLKIVRMW